MKRKIISILIILGLLVGLTAIPAQAATEEEIEESIVAGLAWLVPQQNPMTGSWGVIFDKVACTAFAVVKLEDRAFELGFDSPFVEEYEYSQNVIDGLDYIFSQAAAPGIGEICFSAGWHETYSTGIAMMAIAASRDPNRVVNVPGSAVHTWTYEEVLEANVTYFVAAQNADGGWRYGAPPVLLSDNSNSGYAVLGLRYAEDFGCTIPQSLKDNLSRFIDTIQDAVDGDADDGGSWYALDYPTPWVNLLKTGNLLFEMAFVGDTTDDERVTDALNYIERHWDDTGSGFLSDTGWNNPAHYQAMYCLMKGFESMGIDTITVDGSEVDWFDELSTAIVTTQDPTYGWWPTGNWGDTVLNTEWALLTLQKVAPPPPSPEEPGTRTLGFYKNHPCVVEELLPQTVGESTFDMIEQAMELLWAKPRGDHSLILERALLVAKFNVAMFGIGGYDLLGIGESVNEIIAQGEELLAKVDPEATKDELSAKYELLDEINNYGTDVPLPEEIAEQCPPGGGPPKPPPGKDKNK